MNQQQSQERPHLRPAALFQYSRRYSGIFSLLQSAPTANLWFHSPDFSWLSKKEQPLKPQAIVGIILGCICILFSFFIFFQYMWAMNIMEDPANAGIIKEIYRQTQEMLESMAPAAQ